LIVALLLCKTQTSIADRQCIIDFDWRDSTDHLQWCLEMLRVSTTNVTAHVFSLHWNAARDEGNADKPHLQALEFGPMKRAKSPSCKTDQTSVGAFQAASFAVAPCPQGPRSLFSLPFRVLPHSGQAHFDCDSFFA
jgi:hypothetical protein